MPPIVGIHGVQNNELSGNPNSRVGQTLFFHFAKL